MALEKIEEGAKAIGLESIISDIFSDNSGSFRFHERHGFARTGILRNIGENFGRKFSIVLMQKSL